MYVISTLEQVTPAWLTSVLRRHQLLRVGEVSAVVMQANPAFNSVIVHLQLTFSHPVPAWVPDRLLLKCNRKEVWAIQAGMREAGFYQMVATLPQHPPVIVPCYDAAGDPTTGDSHVLLHDLSASHVTPVTRDQQLTLNENLPTPEHLNQAIDALVRLHAFWWESPYLGTGCAHIGAWCRDATNFTNEIARRRQAWNHLRAREHDWLPSRLVTIYETILDQLFALWQTYTQPRLATYHHLTLTHGDAYLANFLCPRRGQHGNTYLIDWQSPEVYRGVSDVVTMCATFWTRAQRAEWEQPALIRYYRGLQAHGVTNYTWHDLITDYQYSIIDWLLIALQDGADGASKDYWFPKMQCLADAFEDWNCQHLLGNN